MTSPDRSPWLLPAYKLAVLVSLFHLFIAPYTKVEESFTLHATWDILTHRTNVTNVPNPPGSS
jgi:4-amino-4-deoxy-L-arabinose transferase-like glycosyltransferase